MSSTRKSNTLKPPQVGSKYSSKSKVAIYNGDVLDGLKAVPDEAAQLVITSPPYNIGKEYEQVTSLEKYLESQEPVIDELIRILSPRGHLCWQVGNYVDASEVFPLDIFYYPHFKKHGLKLRNRVIWTFDHGLHASKRFSGRYETILWFSKTDDYVFNLDSVRVPSKYPGKRNYKPGPDYGKPSGNPLGKNPSDIWKIVAQDWEREIWDIPNVKANHPEKTCHPCQYPIELIQRCVLALTNEDDLVVDPYMGVGSALLAGLLHNRRVFGCEKEASYVKMAKERINDHYTGKLRIRQIGKPVFVPTGREKVSQVPEEWKQAGYVVDNSPAPIVAEELELFK